MMQAHKILNVSPEATAEEVKRAYHRLAFRHHPDRGGDQRQFVRLCEAYRDQMRLCEKRKTALRDRCLYYTEPDDFVETRGESPAPETSQPKTEPPLSKPAPIRDPFARSLLSRCTSVLRWDETAIFPLFVTIACTMLVTLQVGTTASVGGFAASFVFVLSLLAIPGVLGAIVGCTSHRHFRLLYSQIVLLITAGMTLANPGVLFAIQ